MLLPLLLVLSAAPGKPDAGAPAPTPREMAQLFFLAGDLRRAVESGQRCMVLEGKKKCETFYRALVEYEALIHKNEQLTLDEAKAYLQWDKVISPKEPGKLTVPVIRRYITDPLEAAKTAQDSGDKAGAKAAVERVLKVDPKNADAKKLLEALSR